MMASGKPGPSGSPFCPFVIRGESPTKRYKIWPPAPSKVTNNNGHNKNIVIGGQVEVLATLPGRSVSVALMPVVVLVCPIMFSENRIALFSRVWCHTYQRFWGPVAAIIAKVAYLVVFFIEWS